MHCGATFISLPIKHTHQNTNSITVATQTIPLSFFMDEDVIYTHVTIDEVHERTLDTYVLLGFCKERISQCQLEVALLSATLDKTFFENFFSNFQVGSICVMGKFYKVMTYF